MCEFKGSSRAPGGWNKGVRHSNDVLQARANLKNRKYKDVYGLVHKAFAPAIVGMSGQIHADFLRLIWVLADKQLRSYYDSMGKEDKIGSEAFRWARAKVFNYDLTCKRGSVGQSEGLSIPRSSVRFRLKPDTSNSHAFELHRPSNKGTKLLLKVIKAIIIIIINC